MDASRATVRQTFIERGSGPLHAILRVEGDYRYTRADNNAAPFVMRIHAWAGQPRGANGGSASKISLMLPNP